MKHTFLITETHNGTMGEINHYAYYEGDSLLNAINEWNKIDIEPYEDENGIPTKYREEKWEQDLEELGIEVKDGEPKTETMTSWCCYQFLVLDENEK